ncbi:MAG: flavoprotein [Lachnospiraceae bacterium]|nr:flavoprotein [Lachnospiraceae bacterium]
MNRKEFENALMSTIVDYISDQVILRYTQACKKAAVLFSGALIGYKDAVESLNKLKDDGWKLTAVLSRSASDVLTEERIKNDIDPDAIYVEGAPVNGRQIIDDNQFVIIPSLTINTAAKVANCISDNLLTNMISRAMATGKPIVAAIDGCCPDNKVREQLGFKVTKAYKARMRQNLEDLLNYGITLTTDYSLCKKVNEVFCAQVKLPAPESSTTQKKERMVQTTTEPPKGCIVSEMESGKSIKLDKKVIGRVDIAKNARYKTIVVRSDALLTGLAKDEALNRGITIVKE